MELATLARLHLLIALIIVGMVLLVSICTQTQMLVCFLANLLKYQEHPSHCFQFCLTVLSYYEEKQNEQSDGVCETG